MVCSSRGSYSWDKHPEMLQKPNQYISNSSYIATTLTAHWWCRRPRWDQSLLELSLVSKAHACSSPLRAPGDVQPGQRQPAQCGGDQQHLPGAVAAGQPGLRHPDQALQRGRGGQKQPPDHHPQDSRWVLAAGIWARSVNSQTPAY